MADYHSSEDGFKEADDEEVAVTLDALDLLTFEEIDNGKDEATEQVLEKIVALETALLTQHPSMPTLCQAIHKHLLKHPEVTSVLKPEELGVYIQGLKAVTHIEITAAAPKKKSLTKKQVSAMTLADLI